MSIKVEIEQQSQSEITYPALRVWVEDLTKPDDEAIKYGPLIVLFTGDEYGIPLSGRAPSSIGLPDVWHRIEHEHPPGSKAWAPCTIKLTSIS